MSEWSFPNEAYRAVDRLIAKNEWGIVPQEWSEFVSSLHQVLTAEHDNVVIPAALDQEDVSIVSRRHRFITQLLIAEKLGKLGWALDYIGRLKTDQWLRKDASEAIFPNQLEPIHRAEKR